MAKTTAEICCYLCGSTEDVETDDRLETLPTAKPMCPNCWFNHPTGDLLISRTP